MNRRNFLSLTGTFTGGMLVLPEFLHAYSNHSAFSITNKCVVFIQLNGGNDGLNTFIPHDNPLYYDLRPNININKDLIIGKNKGMGFHPNLSALAQIQQEGNLSVIQNVGYPEPNRSHFRSIEIWQTASNSNEYLSHGWLGRYLDTHFHTPNSTGGVILDNIDNLALKGIENNFISVKDPNKLKSKQNNNNLQLSENPQLDFVRKIADSVIESSTELQKAISNSTNEVSYPKTGLGKNLEWIARLIKGNLNSKVYYTTQNGYDTHDNQLTVHANKLTELNDAILSFYSEMKKAQLLDAVTLVVFSEFGRRVHDNGNGTDHGTAAPMFIIGGKNKGSILGSNPDLSNLSNGDLIYNIDFRSVYAGILEDKLDFDPNKIGIKQKKISGLF